jgi:DNA repair exonuclease SbcCD ATPase subunit
MFFIAIQLDAIEIVVFSFSCLLLAATVYFFRKTILGLRSIKEQQKRFAFRMVSNYDVVPPAKKPASGFQSLFQKRTSAGQTTAEGVDFVVPAKRPSVTDSTSLNEVKDSILQQKQQLDKLWQRVDSFTMERPAPAKSKKEDAGLYEKIEALELEVEEKDEELKKLRKSNEVAQMMASRLEQVEEEFSRMQERVEESEKEASRAKQLAMDLEDAKEEYRQVHKEHQRKAEKLQELMQEQARLHQQLCDTEDKLQEANMQRHQFMKRARILEEMNSDFQNVSDTNSKMKNELRRMGELESMLNMMTEERDHLLRKRAH